MHFLYVHWRQVCIVLLPGYSLKEFKKTQNYTKLHFFFLIFSHFRPIISPLLDTTVFSMWALVHYADNSKAGWDFTRVWKIVSLHRHAVFITMCSFIVSKRHWTLQKWTNVWNQMLKSKVEQHFHHRKRPFMLYNKQHGRVFPLVPSELNTYQGQCSLSMPRRALRFGAKVGRCANRYSRLISF